MADRRDLLKLGVLSSSLSMLSKRGILRLIPASWWDDPHSPATRPFLAPLPVPPAALAEFSASGRRYELVAEVAHLRVHPDMPGDTELWRFRDLRVPGDQVFSALGPTVVMRMNEPVTVAHHNALPANHRGFGRPELTIHHHGGHMPMIFDGFPDAEAIPGFNPVFRSGRSYEYHYPMRDVGFSYHEEDRTERPATQWYHDHLIHSTGPNVYRGLAGLAAIFDELDTGDETGRMFPETNLRLPSGDLFDVGLALTDKLFAPDGSLVYRPENFDGFLGDKSLVNGAIQPFHEVQRRKYRFRILNACNARVTGVALTEARGTRVPFDRIGNDGGLFARTLRAQERMVLAPAERADIVVDFSGFPDGTRLYLENQLPQQDGRGPGGTLENPDFTSAGIRMLEFRVKGSQPVSDPSRVPDVLRPFAPISAAEIARAKRTSFVFERTNGAWAINGRFDDLTRPVATFAQNTPQIWSLENKGGGWWHPLHVHLEFFRVLSRNGRVPPAHERDGMARKDMILLGPNDKAEIFFKFRDFPGRWVFHCHNLEHEDHFMMGAFDVV